MEAIWKREATWEATRMAHGELSNVIRHAERHPHLSTGLKRPTYQTIAAVSISASTVTSSVSSGH
jgi:hypothetical protein